MAPTPVTDEDHAAAVRLALTLVARDDLADADLRPIAELHPKRNTFPAEVFLELAADALGVAGVSRKEPLETEGLFEKFLPECSFRGRSQNERRHYALRAAAMMHGGVHPDLLDDTYWWGDIEDLWEYALYALVIMARVSAERLGLPTSIVAERIAGGRGVALEL